MRDLISRQAAIDAFLTELTKRERKNLLHTWSTVEVKYFITKMLEQMPSAQPKKRTEEHTETHACDCISRLGAIDICNNVIDLWQGQLGEGALVAIKNAINNLPSVQPEIMSDGTLHVIVNADVASIDRILLSQAGTHSGDLYYKDDEKPKRKTGKWIPSICHADGMHHEWCGFHCSICGQATVIRYKFCPNCGAHIRIKEEGGQDEQT